jgi:hypothetical protein
VVSPTIIGAGELSAKVLAYGRIVSEVVREAKEPGFTKEAWAPLADLIAVEEFERVGILRETMNWDEYADFLTEWARSKGFESTLRRMTEAPPFVYYEVEEHHLVDGGVTVVNSMNVFEFNEAGRIRHLDVYLQGRLYAPGSIPDYAVAPPASD